MEKKPYEPPVVQVIDFCTLDEETNRQIIVKAGYEPLLDFLTPNQVFAQVIQTSFVYCQEISVTLYKICKHIIDALHYGCTSDEDLKKAVKYIELTTRLHMTEYSVKQSAIASLIVINDLKMRGREYLEERKQS